MPASNMEPVGRLHLSQDVRLVRSGPSNKSERMAWKRRTSVLLRAFCFSAYHFLAGTRLQSRPPGTAGKRRIDCYLEKASRHGKLSTVFVINGLRHHALDDTFICRDLGFKLSAWQNVDSSRVGWPDLPGNGRDRLENGASPSRIGMFAFRRIRRKHQRGSSLRVRHQFAPARNEPPIPGD